MKYSNDIKKTWQVIRKIVKTESRDSMIKELSIDGKMTSNPELMANSFNTYFTGLAESLSGKILPSVKTFKDYLPASSLNSLVLLPTSPQEIMIINKSLKITNSSGIDDINPHVASQVMDILSDPLAKIINSSLINGEIPLELKIATVTPIYKQGAKTELSNYRPISVLPFFSKLFERIMYDRLFSYIKQKNLLYVLQHGFQPAHSTSMSLLDIQDKISESMDKNEYSLGIFLDLAKAFDTVDHKILLAKLEHYGIRDRALDWLRNYLIDRQQQVRCNNYLSKRLPIRHGVPQGSILGPLLFIIYINDLPNSTSLLHFILFADDTNVFLSNSSYEQLFKTANIELKSVSDWFRANKLSLNLSKTNLILFRSNKKQPPLTPNDLIIDDKTIPQVSSTKFLGVYIDQHLKWKVHIEEINKKITKNIGILKRISHVIPSHILLNLYFTLIYPYLTYCNIVWTSTYITNLNNLIISQKKAVRVVTKSPRNSHTKPLFAQFNLLNVTQLRFVQTCEFMYKYRNNLLPPSFSSYFNLVPHNICLRNKHDYRSIYARTNTRKMSIKFQGPLSWNSLPLNIRSSSCYTRFRYSLRAHAAESIV
jgi:hypothetical protein